MSIKKAREDAKLSRKEVSNLLEIPYRTLQNWELELREVPRWAEKLIIEKLKQIAKERENVDMELTETQVKHIKNCMKETNFKTRKRTQKTIDEDFKRYILSRYGGAKDALVMDYGLFYGDKNKEINPQISKVIDLIKSLTDHFNGEYDDFNNQLISNQKEINAFFEIEENAQKLQMLKELFNVK